MLLKASNCCLRVEAAGVYIDPPQNKPCLKVLVVNLVTIPKMLEPPFKASQRSGEEFAVAFMIFPPAKTISYETTWSHAKPC